MFLKSFLFGQAQEPGVMCMYVAIVLISQRKYSPIGDNGGEVREAQYTIVLYVVTERMSVKRKEKHLKNYFIFGYFFICLDINKEYITYLRALAIHDVYYSFCSTKMSHNFKTITYPFSDNLQFCDQNCKNLR